jgi:hypothetical protein
MALLTKAEILGAQDRKHEVVPVPEWGGDVLVWEMSGYWQDQYEMMLMGLTEEGKGQGLKAENLRATKVAASICDENGEPLFTAADVIALGKKNSKALDRIIEAVERLNKMSEEDKAELAKNSAAQGNGETGESQ